MMMSAHPAPSSPSSAPHPHGWSIFYAFVRVLSQPSLERRILTPQFMALLYGLLLLCGVLGGVYVVALTFAQSILWGIFSLLLLPLALLTMAAVVRVVFEILALFAELVVDIKAISAMKQSIDQIAQMTAPVANIGGSVSEMSSDIKTIAQMYSSIYKISSVTDNLQTIAGMYDAIQKIADVTDNIEAIADMRQTIDDISALRAHIEIIATMQPSIEKIATLTDHIEIIAEMRDSIDKISEIGDMVSKFRRTPFRRGGNVGRADD
jgi:hypothetical protein